MRQAEGPLSPTATDIESYRGHQTNKTSKSSRDRDRKRERERERDIYIYMYVYVVPCRCVNSPPPTWYGPPPGGLSRDQQTYGGSTVCVFVASSSFWLQVDPAWWLQDGQNHAPTMSVLAPMPFLLLLSWVLEASRWFCWNVLGACTVWVLLTSS